MDYRISHPQKTGFLTAFHSNGGWEIGDVFPFSSNSWIVFDTEEEAQKYLLNLIKNCEQQADRWGDWTDTALKFARKLLIVSID